MRFRIRSVDNAAILRSELHTNRSHMILYYSIYFVSDGRLTEQEALDEIRELCNQLQHLRERVPARGTAYSTLSSLLDNCKPASNCLSLKPPPTTTGAGKKQTAIMNNNCASAAPVNVIEFSDKSTNTNTTGEERWLLHPNQANGGACTRISITDDCDNRIRGDDGQPQNSLMVLKLQQQASHAEAVADAISASERSELSFGDLQLQCMCSEASEIDDHATGDSADNCAQSQVTHADSQSCGRVNPTNICTPSVSGTFNIPLSLSNENNHKQGCSKGYKRTESGASCSCGRGQKRSSSMKKAPQRNANRLKTNLSMDGSRDISDCGNEMLQRRCEGGFGSNKSSLDDCELAVTPSPTVSSLSLGGTAVTDDKCSISDGNLTPGSSPYIPAVGAVDETAASALPDPMAMPSSSSSGSGGGNGLADSTDTDPAAGANSSKRNKSSDSKLVIDLNDRSKYTKEVSV